MPSTQSNYGTILNPVRPVPDLTFQQLDGDKQLNIEDLKGKWILVSVANSTCGDNCKDNLYKIRQMRRALGKERGRVERLVILINNESVDSFKDILKDYKGTLVVDGPDSSIKRLLSILAPPSKSAVDHVYIIDPRGNIMMHYLPGADGVGILKDLERLLKVSQIG